MDEHTSSSKNIQWRWVGISFFLYVVFYLLPILAAFGIFSRNHTGSVADIFLGIWIFAGVIAVSALSGFLSKAVTIREPAFASTILFILLLGYGAWQIVSSHINDRVSLFQLLLPALFILFIVFFLSILGAWMGEFAQKFWRPEKQADTKPEIVP